MKKNASGHLAFWEGGSLWVFDVPGAGDGPDRNATHAHHAFQLTMSLGGTFRLHLEDGDLKGPLALVAPDAQHAFEAQGRIALLFVEPESPAGHTLAGLIAGRPAATLNAPVAREAQSLIRQAYLQDTNRKRALRDAGIQACRLLSGPGRNVIDRRVRQMIKWANENLGRAVGMQEVARTVGLSPSRASHLFVEQTGLPFRTYLLWLRLVRAVDAHTAGASLTEAAHKAGFADSAHLSRTFRRMFGLPAASLEMS